MLNHKNLRVYEVARLLVKESYKIAKRLPPEEKYNLIPQLTRASISIKLNIAEGASRKSLNERKRYFEIARGSVVEIDSIAETIIDLEYLNLKELSLMGEHLNKLFSMLSKMM